MFGLSPSAPSPHLRYLSADLVKTPFSTAPPPDAMLQSPRTSNLVGLTSRDSGMPCLSMTSSRRSSVTAACGLPEIPRPLLQPASLSHEVLLLCNSCTPQTSLHLSCNQLESQYVAYKLNATTWLRFWCLFMLACSF